MLVKSAIFSILFIFLLATIGCHQPINPKQIYTVYTVISSDGTKYENLNRYELNDHEYTGIIDNKTYRFNGNYTVISEKITGEQILRLKGLESKSNY